MKTLFLLLNRLKLYVVKNKTIFILFTIGSILTSTFFAYFYGNTEFMQNANDTTLYNRKYTVSLQEPLAYDSEELMKLYESELIESVAIRNNAYEEIGVISSCVKGTLPISPASGRTEFRENEKYSFVAEMFRDYSAGDTVTINGVDLSVIGVAVTHSHVTKELFDELNLEVHSIEIYSAEKYRPGQDGELIIHIVNSLSDNNIDYIRTPSVSKNSNILF